MKKALSLILVLTLCLSLCACGDGGTTEGSSNTSKSTEKPSIKIEDITGTWSQSVWLFETDLVINANGTYDYGNEKGTITLGDAVVFNPNNAIRLYNDFRLYDEYLYCPSASFTKDDEYGLPFSPDENGLTEQEFEVILGSSGMQFDPAFKKNHLVLGLEKTGEFYIIVNTFSNGSFGSSDSWSGTYKYEDSILTLTYEGVDYPLVVADGTIYYMTYTKN